MSVLAYGTWNAIGCWFLFHLFWELKVATRYTSSTFRHLNSNMCLLPLHLLWRDSHLNCSRMLVILPVSKLWLPVTNLAAQFSTFSNSSWTTIPCGSQTGLAYSRIGHTNPLYVISLTSWGHDDRLRLKKPSLLFAFVQTLLTWVFHFKSLEIVTPRYLILSTFSRTVPSKE